MSTAHDIWTSALLADRDANFKPANLLLPSIRFSLFALSAIVAGAVLAFVT